MLGIVVVVYKSYDETVRFITQEISKITIPYKLVIVNNAATINESQKLAQSCGALLVKEDKFISGNTDIYLISHKDNLGYAKGNNLGAAFLNDLFDINYLLFSNTDIIIENGKICEELISILNQINDIGIIGPRILGLDNKDQSPHFEVSFIRYFLWIAFPYLKGRFNFLIKKNKTKLFLPKEGYCYWVSGSFFLVKAKAFFQAGLFDSNTFLYGEEKILAERMLKINKKCYFVPSVCILHEHGKTTTKTFSRRDIESKVFLSDCYYYKEYKNINTLFISLLKIIFFRKPIK